MEAHAALAALGRQALELENVPNGTAPFVARVFDRHEGGAGIMAVRRVDVGHHVFETVTAAVAVKQAHGRA